MEKHGTYHFLNWTDRMGNVVSENTALTVNKMTDQFYRANYERWIPVISVADTIYVGSVGGEYTVQIQNIGQGDIEMDWYVSDSLSSWVSVDGVPQGIDDGYFTFTFEAMRDQGRRIDSLEILAPEIAGMSKMLYVVQDASLLGVSVNIDPEGAGKVVGTGFFEEGDVCTLTAIANEGYSFINWTKNGVEVSTETVYSFTVTENVALVANFEANMVTQTIELEEGWNWFSTFIEASNPNTLLEMLKTSLGENAIQISSSEVYTEYDGDEWWGDLENEGLTNEQMYMILVETPCAIELRGLPTNPANHTITIKPGWNWIGFPSDHEMTILEALGGFGAQEGDVFANSSGYSEYDGEEWFGDVAILVPGTGYLYYSSSDTPKTLVIGGGSKDRFKKR